VYNKDGKYNQPPGTGSIIFHTQSIIDHYINSAPIETLYLVEGEKKAFAAWWHSIKSNLDIDSVQERLQNFYPKNDYGLPIMGITGIWNFKGEDKKTLHDDIRRVILQCKVKNVVMIYDADYCNIPSSFDPESETNTVDLFQKPNQFYQSAIELRMYLSNFIQDFIVMAINDAKHKGLDDLINQASPGQPLQTKILTDLYAAPITKSKFDFFNVLNLTTAKNKDVRSFFCVNISEFFDRHQDKLFGKYFIFNKNTYFGDTDTGKPELKKHGDSIFYARVGIDYFKMIDKPDIYGNIIKEIKKWSKAAITDDYVKKGHKYFMDTIPKYDDFVNIAENDPAHYKREIEQEGFRYFNVYEPVEHIPEPGEWPSIKLYLNHIFGEQIKFGLDYFKLIYEKPAEKLPILCLVSKESFTGKSAFIRLMQNIFQNNAVMIGNQEITDSFNDDYATKLFIGLDEGLIEKAETVEKIKNWATSPTIQMNKKNVARSKVQFFAKMCMTSNHEDNFIRISKTEDRFWVRKINKIEKLDPYLEDKMKEEIPYFLHFLLKEHKLQHEKRQSRLWFRPSDLETEALIRLKNRSGSGFERNLRLVIKELFIEYNQNPRQADRFDTLYMSIKEIIDLSDHFKRLDKSYINNELHQMGIYQYDKVKRIDIPHCNDLTNDDDYLYFKKDVTKRSPYEFKIVDYMEHEEIVKLGFDLSIEDYHLMKNKL
jgi:hypothetical protein